MGELLELLGLGGGLAFAIWLSGKGVKGGAEWVRGRYRHHKRKVAERLR